MTKRDLVIRVAEETGVQQNKVLVVIQSTLDAIAQALVEGKTIELRNFGVFEVQTRRPRKGRNPRKPENSVVIPARKVVKFKMGKVMRDKILKPSMRASQNQPAATQQPPQGPGAAQG